MDKMLGRVLNGNHFYSPCKLCSITSWILIVSLVSDQVYNYKYVELWTFCISGEGKR